MILYYILPATQPPYNRENPYMPQHVDVVRCNWTGHDVPGRWIWICKVNTTEAKHADLASRAGVYQLPPQYQWETIISTMQAAARNFIRNWTENAGLVYDQTETLGEWVQRVINSGLFDIGNTDPNTAFSQLNAGQQQKIVNLCIKWGLAYPQESETFSQISKRTGRVFWDAPSLMVEEF